MLGAVSNINFVGGVWCISFEEHLIMGSTRSSFFANIADWLWNIYLNNFGLDRFVEALPLMHYSFFFLVVVGGLNIWW